MCEEKRFEGVHDKVEVKCEGCTDFTGKGEAFCCQCAEFICKECIKSHQVMKLFASHEVFSLENLIQGLPRECDVHEKPFEVYCFDCDASICLDCTKDEHCDHSFKFSRIAAPDTKTSVLKKLCSLKQVATNLSSAMKVIKTNKVEVEAKKNFVAHTIQTSFDEFHNILDKRENELLVEALKLQDNKAKSTHAGRNQIQREVEEHSGTRNINKLVEEAEMGVEVRCTDALRQLIQTSAKITLLDVDPVQCTVDQSGPSESLVSNFLLPMCTSERVYVIGLGGVKCVH